MRGVAATHRSPTWQRFRNSLSAEEVHLARAYLLRLPRTLLPHCDERCVRDCALNSSHHLTCPSLVRVTNSAGLPKKLMQSCIAYTESRTARRKRNNHE